MVQVCKKIKNPVNKFNNYFGAYNTERQRM